MNVALLGDVHANLPALEAVLTHAYQHNIEAIWNIGDWVGYNAFPNEVIKRLQREGAISIVGNYDIKVLKFPKKQEKWQKSKRFEKWLAFKWAYDTLKKKHRKYLAQLPKEKRLQVAGRTVLLTHGSPASNNEGLTAETPEHRLQELAQLGQADVIVCGHSHRPFARQAAGAWFINTGSVGRPDDGDPRACYAILRLTPNEMAVQHYRLDYDIEKAVAALKAHNLPDEFGQMLRQGRNLDEVSPR